MRLLKGKEAARRVRGFLSNGHQIHAYGVDLTAARVYSLRATGAIDFGGSELLAAEPIPLPTYQKHSQDRYQWWTLVHGAYLVECNESLELPANEIALLEPHERLLQSGAGHATRHLRHSMDPVYFILDITIGKIELKQNARLSVLRIFRLEGSAAPIRPRRASKTAKKRVRKKAVQQKRVARKTTRKAGKKTAGKRKRR